MFSSTSCKGCFGIFGGMYLLYTIGARNHLFQSSHFRPLCKAEIIRPEFHHEDFALELRYPKLPSERTKMQLQTPCSNFSRPKMLVHSRCLHFCFKPSCTVKFDPSAMAALCQRSAMLWGTMGASAT